MSQLSASAKENIFALMKRLRGMPDVEYVKYLIAYHAAPTLLGIKPATLLCPDSNGRDPGRALKHCVPCLARMFGVKVASFRNRAGALLFLVYNPALLRRALSPAEVRELLTEAGYETRDASVESLLEMLGKKCSGRFFPHEIGVFLGYPAEDVRRFMVDGGRGCRLAGFWKAYKCEDQAKRCMELYQLAKMRAAELIAGGAEFDEVADGLRTVAIAA